MQEEEMQEEAEMTSIKPTPNVESRPAKEVRAQRRGWLRALLAVFIVVGASILVVWLIPASKATQTEVFEGEVDQLVIDVTGDVSLAAGESTQMTVTKEWLFAGEPSVVTGHENGIARLTGECSWWQIRCTTSVSGTVTTDAAIEVTTAAGSIEVSGTTGGVDLETSAGSVHADDVVGPARLETSAGNIIGTITDGDVDAETSAGRIELTVLGEFASLSASTSAGSVDLTVTDDVYDVDADTSVGSVNVSVRTDPSAGRQIFAESSAGSITIKPAP
ncbi:MAG TPA: DUF4097 family beta strand repeat-containing protein [Acidimicrobiia bacterium]